MQFSYYPSLLSPLRGVLCIMALGEARAAGVALSPPPPCLARKIDTGFNEAGSIICYDEGLILL